LAFPSPANEIPVGAMDSTTNGIEVDVEENGADDDTDIVTIKIPASKAADGRLFGRLKASRAP
jgi:hypothetical protein